MKARTLKQLLLYNYRYLFAYSCIAVFGVFFLGWRIWSLPPGLADIEIATAIRHIQLADILHMPLYPLHAVLQWFSMEIMGASPLSMRLPSVLLAGATVILVYHILKRWFGKPAALLGATLLVSADWYLFVARLGVGSIEFTFWLALAFISLTKLVSHRSKWLLPLSLSLTLLLFAPFGIFAVVPFIICLFVIGVFRSRILEARKLYIFTSLAIAVIGILSLITASLLNHEFAKSLFGLTDGLPSINAYLMNVITNTSAAVVMLPSNNPIVGVDGLFYIRYFEFVFILFGLIMLWRTRVNKFNIVVLVLSLTLALGSGLSDGSRGGSLLLLPAIIYMSAGIRHLMHRWQKTFPKNPYARITAYAPMGLLVVLVMSVHYYTYFRVWPNQTSARMAFSKQYLLLKEEVSRKDGTCIIVKAPQSLQTLIAQTKQGCRITFQETVPRTLKPEERVILAARNIQSNVVVAGTTATPLVSDLKEASLHWWVIQPDQNNQNSGSTPDIIDPR